MQSVILPNLFIGKTTEIPNLLQDPSLWRVVNTASTLHYAMHQWDQNDPTLKSQYCYVIHEDPLMISINWVDAKFPDYFDYQGLGVSRVLRILRFIDDAIQAGRSVFVCCNQGLSRSPSIVLLYLVRRGLLPKESLGDAREVFQLHYPAYSPGVGIQKFIERNWEVLSYSERKEEYGKK